jgi:hypothetical protein
MNIVINYFDYGCSSLLVIHRQAPSTSVEMFILKCFQETYKDFSNSGGAEPEVSTPQ